MNNEITLRPHHALCIQHFVGSGYNKRFVKNMSELIEYLESESDFLVKLKVEFDVICDYCPNVDGGVCRQHDKVNRYDYAVLNKCGLLEGQDVKWKDLKMLIKEKIIDSNCLSDVCHDCSWISICEGVKK